MIWVTFRVQSFKTHPEGKLSQVAGVPVEVEVAAAVAGVARAMTDGVKEVVVHMEMLLILGLHAGILTQNQEGSDNEH